MPDYHNLKGVKEIRMDAQRTLRELTTMKCILPPEYFKEVDLYLKIEW